MPFNKIPVKFKVDEKTDVVALHKALDKLDLNVAEGEKTAKKVEASTVEAVKKFQKANKLKADGKLDDKTITAMNEALHDSFISANKYRTKKLHELLEKVNLKVAKKDTSSRKTGASTRKAIEEFQKKAGMTVNGIMSEEVFNRLEDEVVKERLKTPTQKRLLHTKLQKVNKVAGLKIDLAADELKNKELGSTSEKLIKAFQKKYSLPETGTVDKATLDKMDSVAASKGSFVRKIGRASAKELTIITKPLRLNKVSPEVNNAQKALSFLGYKISEKEFKTQTFGKTTRQAVLSFQKSKGFAETGHLDKVEMKALNSMIASASPGAGSTSSKYRVRGSVRDDLWQRKPNMVIKVFEKLLDKESAEPLASKKNFSNGFFDIAYDPPLDPITGQIKQKFHLVVKLYEPVDNDPAHDKLISSQNHYDAKKIHWVNFTDGDSPYLGDSDFASTDSLLRKAAGATKIGDLHETANEKQITQLSVQTGLDTDDIMRLILAYRVAKSVNQLDPLSPEAFYAFLRQNLPAGMPGDLLRGTSDWTTIDQLTELAATGIVFAGDELQQQTIDNAIALNLVSRTMKVRRDAILQELKNKRNAFILEKPILVGNQNLKTLLDNSKINAADYPEVVSSFVANKGINTAFWAELNTKAPVLGAAEIKDFTTTVELGNLAKNHIETLTFFKNKIGADPKFKSASSFAKLDKGEITALIGENGNAVPANIPGNSADEKVAAFAAAIKKRSELLFPAASLVGEVKRSNTAKLTKLPQVEKFIDDNPDLNFKQQNVDKYLLDNGINLDAKTKEEVKLVQRAHKLASDPMVGTALIDEGLHSSMQIYFAGKSQLADTFKARGISEQNALHVYEFAKMQYMQILARLLEFRHETNNGTPAVINNQLFKIDEVKAIIGDIPNLELLFGSLDFCECEHCKSLFSPSAYFTDVLRFISEHTSLVKKDAVTFFTVKEILFQRRPDLGNIKLNCQNTETPLPYIDLVCEILESYVAPQQTNFSNQSTLEAKELKAIPQYVRLAAYDKIAISDFPMNSSFNLYQEEARTFLKYLRAPRFALMETFQDISNNAAKVPDDVAIAAEYFGISSFEKELIITPKQNAGDQNTYWGFDTTQAKVSVTSMKDRSKLSYNELLELLLVRFVNDPAVANRSEIERPSDSCNTGDQQVNNLSVARFDLMHRFLRLWRRTGWKMWELDLLIRNPKIGNSVLDGNALVNLKTFKELMEKLKLPFEVMLAFYSDINREVRIKPDKPDVKVDPLYKILFQNIAVTNPLDDRFKAVDNNDDPVDLDAAIVFGINAAAPFNGYTPVPTVLSTLALTQADFDLLVGKTNSHLSVNSLSTLLRYTYLARGMKLTIKDLLLFLGITNTNDPFATVKTTADCVENLSFIKSSKFSLLELDYILNFSADSSVGLRDETLVLFIESLRKTLAANKDELDELNLTEADRNTILGLDAPALVPMTNANLLAALLPLQNILNGVSTNFGDAGFSIDESTFITRFTAASINAANKAKLVECIEKLQENLTALLDRNQNQIRSQVASSFNVTDSQASILLGNLSLAPAPESLLEVLDDEALIEKDSDGTFKKEVTRANFPTYFNAYSLLHKAAMIVLRFGFSDKDLEWFTTKQGDVNTLDLSKLPVSAGAVPNDYSKWLNLYKFLAFKLTFPEPEDASIRSILDLARNAASTKDQIFDEIVKLTQWSKPELTSLDVGFHLKHAAGDLDYTNAETYRRLKKCFDQMKLTGVNAETMFDWALINNDLVHDKTVAVQTRKSVKSKYEQDDWLDKITPLQNDLREKKRTALVEYHLENSQRNEAKTVVFNGKEIPNPLYWKDPSSLFKFFLIDVEMSSCQLTSRIKQAISSVQLFVQRCFLNLENRYVKVTEDEKEDVASVNAWSQWRWMKNYRIWEANRKIFFYPENWIEPELRDDKSPFFQDLENELLQGEVTPENVEAAFLNYLHKVDEVSHLEICGLYHQMENLAGDETLYEVNIVHVIGRSKAFPHAYYYRYYDMNYMTWSAWDKIDVEIDGDQVVPVVYNRKLHLFWLQFVEKPLKTKKVPPPKPETNDNPKDSPEPLSVIEIQLGWIIKKKSGWTKRKMSRQKLIHPWGRPQFSYNLKPFYLAKFNELYLDIYLSTSKEFNDGKFYDPFVPAQNNPVKLTKNAFNETYLPWHSSSFVFNGEVKSVEIKALQGSYHLEPNTNLLFSTDSYNYVHTNFDPQGKMIGKLSPLEFGPRLRLPSGMHYNGTRLTNNQVHSTNPSHLRVLENGTSPTILATAISPFELVITQQDLQLNTTSDHPMFYQDSNRAFFIKPEWEAVLNNYGQVISNNRKYRFLPFFHPYTVLFIRELNRDGIDGLLNRKIQTTPQNFSPVNSFNFNSYAPLAPAIPDSTAQKDINDFSPGGAYSIYNWELFFHAPLMIACRLMQNQKFEDAMKWFHYIFDPTNIEDLPTPQRFWITKPFFEYNADDYRKQRIESILTNIDLAENKGQLIAWRNNPFNPHLIARYRPVAYQKNVVMKYLDNLISWGDMLFGRDTIESINEASLLYMLAYEILGDRPQKVPNVKHEEMTFNELEPKLDEFGNARVDVVIEDTLLPVTVTPSSTGTEPIPKIETFYFCIPNNDFLTKYWDKVEDRLFKIRNCMNIQGIVRQLPLFEPPIDPALLVKAAAAGIDLSSVLNDLAAPTPHYRFRVIVQKAIELCNEVKLLGDKLLTVLQSKDAEELAVLRSQHEIQLLEAVKEVREKQIDDAVESIGSLNKAMELADAKKLYYEGREFMNAAEIAGGFLTMGAVGMSDTAATLQAIAAVLNVIPTFSIGIAGFGGSPNVSVSIGGAWIASVLQSLAAQSSQYSNSLSQLASLSNITGNYTRRQEEWTFQASLATIEKEQIQFQINAAEIRQAIAEKELENQELQIENAKTVDDFMKNKFTNKQLFSWMITQVSTVYFQAYQIAFEMAKKAEKCFQAELGVPQSSYIQFGYWDSLKKGLTSGDKLATDLRRLESAFVDQNKREYEITKQVSLAQMFPLSLITLRETGKCTISLPEWLFDMDYPGHYMRRIKNVSVTIPCIVGPYTNVNCTLSLLRNETRISSVGNYDKVDENDDRFRTTFGPISSIATSNAQLDSGMFELNFNDDRYLPFEGAGAISDWQIDMPIENNYFDFNSLSDVILHLSYTSRSGGGLLASGANTNLQAVLPNSAAKVFSFKHEFGTEWHRFLNPQGGADQEFVITLKPEHYPFFVRGNLSTIKIKELDMFVETAEAGDFTANIKVTNKNPMNDLAISTNPSLNDVHHLSTPAALTADLPSPLGELRVKIKLSAAGDFKSLGEDKIHNIYVLVRLGT
jgi:peptidoglycan hydrolase-like protein with peptidoglycan-binding domain